MAGQSTVAWSFIDPVAIVKSIRIDGFITFLSDCSVKTPVLLSDVPHLVVIRNPKVETLKSILGLCCIYRECLSHALGSLIKIQCRNFFLWLRYSCSSYMLYNVMIYAIATPEIFYAWQLNLLGMTLQKVL